MLTVQTIAFFPDCGGDLPKAVGIAVIIIMSVSLSDVRRYGTSHVFEVLPAAVRWDLHLA